MDLTERNTSKNRIDWFDDFEGPNKRRYLSNFYDGCGPLEFADVEFMTGEHFFAALKANNRDDFERVAKAKSPARAKAIGRRIELRKDWELVKYDAMRVVLATKFNQDRLEAAWLIATGDSMLVEGTDWNDMVWGVTRSNGLGRNWLGVLLMARRAELVAESRGCEPFDYSWTTKFVTPAWIKEEAFDA